MKLHHALVVSALSLSSSLAFAGSYGLAGCGLGSVFAPIVEWGPEEKFQIFVATTNGIYSNNTFGMSSGTSNCKESSASAPAKAKKKTAQQVYLQYNLAQVKADAAKGEGEYIEGLAGLFGCQNLVTGSYADFAQVSQSNHNEIFTSDKADVVWENYVNSLNKANLSCVKS
jgi:hypothetical protein